MSDLHGEAKKITTRADLALFVEKLRVDMGNETEECENAMTERFLGSLAAWIKDTEGRDASDVMRSTQQPSWRAFAELLLAARIYE
jgi:hypothetical protein